MINSYRDLVVWNEAMELVEFVYQISNTLPDSERFGLTSQMQRAAVSIPSDILPKDMDLEALTTVAMF